MRQLAPVAAILLLSAACGRSAAPEPAQDEAGRPRDAQIESFDGVPISYSVHGAGEGALLLIHCWSCDRGYWEAQVEDLAADFKVITVDLAGHGDSGLDRREWVIESFGRDVEAVANALGLQSVVLVGHSMGGPVALEAARRMPGRVVGVIAVDALHDVDVRYPEELWDELLASYEKDFAGTCNSFVRSMFLVDANPDLVSEVATDMCSSPPHVALALLRDFRRYDAAGALGAAGVPVRCINAARTHPTNVEGNRRYAADFDVYVMEGVGHFPMLERPAEFNRLLRQAVEDLTSARGI